MKSKNAEHESANKISALENNINAIKSLVASVEGTLGPKGMDCMIVDDQGDFMITNDGVSILMEMDVSHPAAIMMIHGAYAQQGEVGDGTTTMSIITGQILDSALYHIKRGVPVQKIIEGMNLGIIEAISYIKSKSMPIHPRNIHSLKDVANIAGRGNQDVVDLIFGAAQSMDEGRLKDRAFRFSSIIQVYENADNEVVKGMIIDKKPLNIQLDKAFRNVKIAVIDDALEPESLTEELLNTENGFNKYIDDRENFKQWIQKLIHMGIGAVFTDRNIDAYAEQSLVDAGILVVNRVSNVELIKLSEYTGAKPIKRNVLGKTMEELENYWGKADEIVYHSRLQHIRVLGGIGTAMATIVVSASTGAIAMEKERVAKDAAAALQAAIIDGIVPGGGSIEMACALELERKKSTMDTMIKYGVECVIDCLQKPMYHIVKNAGFDPLQKIEKVMEAMRLGNNIGLGINCDTGEVEDLLKLKVIDPALVKVNALKTAREISEAILRINLILKGKSK